MISLIKEITCHGIAGIDYAEAVTTERVPDFRTRDIGEFAAIHSKLAYQTIDYFCRKSDWRGQNSVETGSTWG
jgi:hypothetical protein